MDNGNSTPGESPCKCGWMGRNWKWFVPVLLLICGALFVSFVTKGELVKAWLDARNIKTSPPFQMAMEQLRADAEVVKQLGEPLEQEGAASGEVSTDNAKSASGNANFYFDLKGPKGTATVHCQGKMIDGKWGISILAVTFADGSRHSIDVAGDDSLEEAPAWSP